MSEINLNPKNITARLLANENIHVEYGKFSTAFFDVKNRVLGMPLWGVNHEGMIDMLIGHEVSHALHTPPAGWHDATKQIPGCPRSFINIVEDIRIERLILQKYPGLLQSFVDGYKVILERDIFKMEGRPISSFGFMDRLNIKAKFRTLVDVPFNDEEMYFYDLAMSVETWDDVIHACREIYEWLKDKQHEMQARGDGLRGNMDDIDEDMSEGMADEIYDPSEEGQENQSNSADPDGNNQAEKSDEEAEGEGKGSGGEEGEDEDGNGDGEDKSTGSGDKQDDGEAEADSTSNGADNGGVESVVNQDLEHVDTDYAQRQFEQTSSDHDSSPAVYRVPEYSDVRKMVYNHDDLKATRGQPMKSFAHRIDIDWAEYRKMINPRVNLMVKEFERRKSAYRTKRARTSTKGSLDVNKLYRHKFDDHLFQQAVTLADAKNHGMMMVIDFSISMKSILQSTLRQTLILIEFCRRVQIPFEVWTFTSASDKVSNGVTNRRGARNRYTNLPHVCVGNLQMVNLVNSKLSRADYEEACKSMYDISYRHSELLQLHYTPLASSVLLMDRMCDEFKRVNRLDKMNMIVLTDGQGSDLSFSDASDWRFNQDSRHGEAIRIDGKFVKCQHGDHLKAILEHMRSKGTTVINIHLLEPNDRALSYDGPGSYFDSFIGAKGGMPKKEYLTKFKNEGMVTFDDINGYDRLILLNTDGSFNTRETKVDLKSSSTKAVRGAFADVAKQKKVARSMAMKFVELVA